MNQQILKALSKKLGDGFHISIHEILKTNVKLDGLTIIKNGKDIAPIIYLEPFYDALHNGVPIDDVAGKILQAYSNSEAYPGHFDIAPFLTYDLPCKKIYVKLINKHLNRELLQDVPHSLFLDDFAVTVRCMINATEKENSSFLVHNCHLNLWKVDQESLLSCALHNTRAMMGIHLQTMENVLQSLGQDLMGTGIPDIPIWVMTNRQKLSGAATVLFDDALKGFSREHGSFYVIFSSVHEVLLIPESYGFMVDSLTRINQQVNTTAVKADEILGTKAYYYDQDKGFLF